MATIKEIQDEIILEFNDFDDWLDRYQLLIDLGGEQEPLPDEYKTDNNLIEGCQSRVWLQADYVDGKVFFRAESDALIVNGIVSLLIKVYCLYAYDAYGQLYRVFWTDWDGLSEKDRIVVEYSDIKEIDQTTNPSTGWNPKYEITATNVKLEHNK